MIVYCEIFVFWMVESVFDVGDFVMFRLILILDFVLLFCYLVLMFNVYCIYYDYIYVIEIEVYFGFVVYGFLQVMLFLNLVVDVLKILFNWFLFCGFVLFILFCEL